MKQIIYSPYKEYNAFIITFEIILFFCVIIALDAQSDWLFIVLFLVFYLYARFVIGILSGYLKQSIVFCDEGIRVIGDKNTFYSFISWNAISYCYTQTPWHGKGGSYWILTSSSLSDKEQREVLRTWKRRHIIAENIVVIHQSFIQKIIRLEIEKLFQSKVTYSDNP